MPAVKNSIINNDANITVELSFILRSHTGCHLSRTTYERSGNSVTHLDTNPNALPPISSTMTKAAASSSKRLLLQFIYRMINRKWSNKIPSNDLLICHSLGAHFARSTKLQTVSNFSPNLQESDGLGKWHVWVRRGGV